MNKKLKKQRKGEMSNDDVMTTKHFLFSKNQKNSKKLEFLGTSFLNSQKKGSKQTNKQVGR